MNSVHLSGRVASDPEIREFDDSTLCRFSLAVSLFFGSRRLLHRRILESQRCSRSTRKRCPHLGFRFFLNWINGPRKTERSVVGLLYRRGYLNSWRLVQQPKSGGVEQVKHGAVCRLKTASGVRPEREAGKRTLVRRVRQFAQDAEPGSGGGAGAFVAVIHTL